MRSGTITLLALSCLFVFGCGKKSAKEEMVRKAVAENVNLRDVISQTGEIQPVVKVELKSEASGKIEKIFIKEGERLKKGDKILKIDPTRLLTQKEKLDLAVQKARLNHKLAKRDYDNARQLFDLGQMPQKKLEDLKNEFELREIALKEQELELEDIAYQLTKTLIVSSMDGVLISLLVEEGEIAVSATSGFSGGTAIGTVADISQLEVLTKIGEVDYAKIKTGQQVQISMESDARMKTSGTVSFVSMAAKKETNSNISYFEVRIAIDSILPALVPGVNVNVDFVVLERKNVLGVPFTFVQKNRRKDREDYFVYRPAGSEVRREFTSAPEEEGKEEGKRRRPGFGGENMQKRMDKKQGARTEALKSLNLIPSSIKVGATDYKFYEVLDGLAPGDTVVKILGGENL